MNGKTETIEEKTSGRISPQYVWHHHYSAAPPFCQQYFFSQQCRAGPPFYFWTIWTERSPTRFLVNSQVKVHLRKVDERNRLWKRTLSRPASFPHQRIIVVFKAPGRHLVGGRLSSLQLENNVEKAINDAGELANITYLVSIQDHASSRYLVLDHTPAVAVFYLASRLTYGMLASTLY